MWRLTQIRRQITKGVLLSLQKEYLDVMNGDDPQQWFPNEKARQLTSEKLAKQKKRT